MGTNTERCNSSPKKVWSIITKVVITKPAKAGQLTQTFIHDDPSTPGKFYAPIDLLTGDSVCISIITGTLYKVEREGEIVYTGNRFYIDTESRSKHRIIDSSTGFRFSVYDAPLLSGPEHPHEDLAEVLVELLNKIPLPDNL